MRAIRESEKERAVPPMAAIALTAYATSKDRTRCIQAGYQAHIPKPGDPEELFTLIEALGLRPVEVGV